ncbi:MAG: DUF3611 family protein [Limnospira sp. PMC 1234.20]|uniref:DUF3611 family protein n=1 Tax=Limnospira sp. PMC 1234.20 TaxID=2981032 RepID=UPI0028E17099|nr:DUF3611 family protein [Limnospira sp. PMC 1234.20]MDT9269955.1 DUF3611 family protein [Limnospira sp. PMC 1234.20]
MSVSVGNELQQKGKTLQNTGLCGLTMQVVFAFVAILSLIFTTTGRSISDDANPALGVSVTFAVTGLIIAGFSIVISFRYANIGKQLLSLNTVKPKKSDTVRLLRVGLLLGMVGILIALMGSGITASVLIAKTISQPPGTTLTEASEAVRALDVFVMIANLNVLATHYVGSVASIWLLYRI